MAPARNYDPNAIWPLCHIFSILCLAGTSCILYFGQLYSNVLVSQQKIIKNRFKMTWVMYQHIHLPRQHFLADVSNY